MTRATTAETPIGDLSRSWKRYLRAEGKADTTARNYLLTLKHFAAWLEREALPATPAEIDADTITDFLLDVADQTSGSNAAFHYRNLRAMYHWLTSRREQALKRSENPMLDVAEPKAVAPPRPSFTDDEVAAMLKACKGNGFFARRDEAIIRLFYSTGMRISGMAGLTYRPDTPQLDNPAANDVFLDGRQPLVRLRLKGGEVHLVPIGPKAVLALDRYLRVRSAHRHADRPELWLGPQGGIGPQAVHYMLKRRGAQAKITSRVHAHRFRRTLTTRLLDEGVDRAHVAKILGWNDLRNVALYASDTEQQRAWDAVAQAGIDSRV
ncbi:tyrosine-type recombinase/integrase [Nocardiopsis lucentensis]|uniref:tyrosine-type recombinase/integrase n=1 Tax=Nocardiopsis lucentensis TaxID=53441 RepID=UPI00034D4300|nr:tyrosine-type recombinase/integrase [Nocardiopsis lucentensis]